jgi:enoyl-CoA hydratase/carnithine racemase
MIIVANCAPSLGENRDRWTPVYSNNYSGFRVGNISGGDRAMTVRLEREGAVGVIVLDRPPANSYDYDFLKELGAAVDEARYDDGVRAVVVASASEKFFSAGADVVAFRSGSPNQRAMTALLAHEVFRKFENTPMVFVAAIAGHALGGGLELALACDLRFAAAGGYRIGLPEVTLGLFPGSGGTQRLPRLVGLSKGLDLIATGRAVTPEEARELGIVDQLLDDATACRAAAVEYCAKLAAGPTEAIGRAKVATSLGFGAPLDLGLAIEREAIARIFVSEDAQEGIAAFSEKRKPAYKGR